MSSTDEQHDRISKLIEDLSGTDTDASEWAQAELIEIGAMVLEPLLARVLELDDFGQLCAIQVFRELNSSQAGDRLITLLRSDNEVVRDWSAQALGELGVTEAVPHLKRLLAERKAAGDPPDSSEAVDARYALTQLGAREPVVPKSLREMLFDADRLTSVVGDSDLERALDALAAADQVVPYYQRWQPWKDTWAWVDAEGWDLDWTQRWARLVQDSHEAGIAAAARRRADPTYVVTIEWLDADDWVDL